MLSKKIPQIALTILDSLYRFTLYVIRAFLFAVATGIVIPMQPQQLSGVFIMYLIYPAVWRFLSYMFHGVKRRLIQGIKPRHEK